MSDTTSATADVTLDAPVFSLLEKVILKGIRYHTETEMLDDLEALDKLRSGPLESHHRAPILRSKGGARNASANPSADTEALAAKVDALTAAMLRQTEMFNAILAGQAPGAAAPRAVSAVTTPAETLPVITSDHPAPITSIRSGDGSSAAVVSPAGSTPARAAITTVDPAQVTAVPAGSGTAAPSVAPVEIPGLA